MWQLWLNALPLSVRWNDPERRICPGNLCVSTAIVWASVINRFRVCHTSFKTTNVRTTELVIARAQIATPHFCFIFYHAGWLGCIANSSRSSINDSPARRAYKIFVPFYKYKFIFHTRERCSFLFVSFNFNFFPL